MALTERERAYLLHWQEVARELDGIRDRELRWMTAQERLDIMDRLLTAGIQIKQRTESGLLEWQKLANRHLEKTSSPRR